MVVTQIRQLAARGVSVFPPRYDLKHEAGGDNVDSKSTVVQIS